MFKDSSPSLLLGKIILMSGDRKIKVGVILGGGRLKAIACLQR